MNTLWKEHLKDIPLNGSQDLPDCALCDLSHLGLIQLEGEDAIEFMQGQFTNDSRELTPEHSQLSALCSPKGRMLGLFRILPSPSGWLLQLPIERVEPIKQRLQMFVLRAKVSLSDVSQEWVSMGLAGSCAESLIEKALGSAPGEIDGCVIQDGVTVVRLQGDLPRFLLLAPNEQAQALWQRLSDSAQPCDSETWKLLAIRAGEPIVHAETVEAFVPQMANLQLVNGLSFSKGCYTGQEVVARMQYLGKLKRRMYRAQLSSEEPVTPGTELFSAQSQSGQGAGRVVEAARTGADQWELLAVLESSLVQADLHLGAPEGPQLQIQQLPYALEDNSQ